MTLEILLTLKAGCALLIDVNVISVSLCRRQALEGEPSGSNYGCNCLTNMILFKSPIKISIQSHYIRLELRFKGS